jgi:protein-S-isoprenylcysteine O-methyltransferase Ste14
MSGRGGGWVVAQFVLIGVCIAAAWAPVDWPSGIQDGLSVLGALLALAGATVAVAASRALGRGLTPFPHPVRGAPLVDTGPYRLVRHPIYFGGLLFFAGWSLWAGPVALAVAAALGVLWAKKAALEERHLLAAHPGYADYASRVRRRLVPGVY